MCFNKCIDLSTPCLPPSHYITNRYFYKFINSAIIFKQVSNKCTHWLFLWIWLFYIYCEVVFDLEIILNVHLFFTWIYIYLQTHQSPTHPAVDIVTYFFFYIIRLEKYLFLQIDQSITNVETYILHMSCWALTF